MPEKPEVITVANTLKDRLINRKIINCHVYWDNIIEYPSNKEFIEQIKNQTIHNITTRGKWILFELDYYYLLVHLRMEGKFFFRTNEERNKHEHVIFDLNNKENLRFHDVRKFGKMHLIKKEEINERKPLNKLGYEYYDKNLTSNYLKDKLKNKNIPIKTALLDQSIITGIGNIYDDEVLFLCKINPNTKAKDLNIKQLQSIIDNTKIVLDKAIKKGGTTIKSFSYNEGVHGLFQNELLVHTKKLCPNCNNKIEKIKINGRGTYFCPNCQK